VTPHHSPDNFNFPRLFTSPSTSPPRSPIPRRQPFDVPEKDRTHADQGLSSPWRANHARRRHSDHADTEVTTRDRRPSAARSLLRRQPSDSTTVPCGTLPEGIRPSNTWSEQRCYRLPDTNDDDDDDHDSESDGEGWC